MNKLNSEIERLFQSINKVDELLDNCITDDLDDDTVVQLIKLFKSKISHYKIFDLFLKTNRKDIAVRLLLDYYLGKSIDISFNSKDHVCDLDMFFDSLVIEEGEGELKKLFLDNYIPLKNINSRVIEAIRFSLDIEEEETPSWLKLERPVTNFNNKDINELLSYVNNEDRYAIKEWAEKIDNLFIDHLIRFDKETIKENIEGLIAILMEVCFKKEDGEYLHSIDYLKEKCMEIVENK